MATSFNSTVSARTRCAQQIKDNPDLFSTYESVGGQASDLDQIIQSGTRAQALNLHQSQAGVSATAASTETAMSFYSVQREYSAVMAVVRAVDHDLEVAGAPEPVRQAIKKILVNESQIRLTAGEEGGAKTRAGQRSRTQEATRNEIEKDATALLALTEAHEALARRKVDVARLEALKASAQALAGKLADRATKKGAVKTATAEERKAVQEQEQAWSACYRLLAAVGSRDARVEALLRDAKK